MDNNKAQRSDDDLVKEVFAQFGLCMYLGQVFESGLINILTTLANAYSDTPTQENFDVLYSKHKKLTFGNLIRGLKRFKIIKPDLEKEILHVKNKRDHLAHHFFRDHDKNFITNGGCEFMISELQVLQEEFSELDNKVNALLISVMEKAGLDSKSFKKNFEKRLNESIKDAITRAEKGNHAI